MKTSFKFSKESQRQLDTCVEPLQEVFNCVIQHKDCKILIGHRSKELQTKAFKEGHGVAWPKSNHNKEPSLAVDVMPYYKEAPHIRWAQNPKVLLQKFTRGLIDINTLEVQLAEWRELHAFANFVLGVAAAKKIPLRWGGHYKSFFDGPHYEIMK